MTDTKQMPDEIWARTITKDINGGNWMPNCWDADGCVRYVRADLVGPTDADRKAAVSVGSIGSSFEGFLKDEGVYDEIASIALKRAYAAEIIDVLKKCRAFIEGEAGNCPHVRMIDSTLATLDALPAEAWMDISTKEPSGVFVLVAMPNGKVTYAALNSGRKAGWWGYDGTRLREQPTHWQPLPEPPNARGE